MVHLTVWWSRSLDRIAGGNSSVTADHVASNEMATQDDVRRIALSLPDTSEDADAFRFWVAGKAFVWAWRERIHPKRARVPSQDVIAVRVSHEFEKATLIDMDPAVFFTEPHYDGYPAILVRLAAIDLDLLEVILTDGWRSRAPKRLVAAMPRIDEAS
jgi:hypothetical protein